MDRTYKNAKGPMAKDNPFIGTLHTKAINSLELLNT
jgi:hypothetical protein